jgi:hypothetical protein
VIHSRGRRNLITPEVVNFSAVSRTTPSRYS